MYHTTADGNTDFCWTPSCDIQSTGRHRPPDRSRSSSSACRISPGLKSHNTALDLIRAICAVINPGVGVHTFLPNKQAEVDTTSSNSSLQAHATPWPKSNFAPGFFWGPCLSEQAASCFYFTGNLSCIDLMGPGSVIEVI